MIQDETNWMPNCLTNSATQVPLPSLSKPAEYYGTKVQIYYKHCFPTYCLLCYPRICCDPPHCTVHHFRDLLFLPPNTICTIGFSPYFCCPGCKSPPFYLQLLPLPPTDAASEVSILLSISCCFSHTSPILASPILPYLSQAKARFLELSWATHCSHIGKELPLHTSTSFSMLGALGLLLYYQTGFGGFFWLYLHLRFQSSRRLRSRYGRTLCTMIWNLYHHILFEERKGTNAISQW